MGDGARRPCDLYEQRREGEWHDQMRDSVLRSKGRTHVCCSDGEQLGRLRCSVVTLIVGAIAWASFLLVQRTVIGDIKLVQHTVARRRGEEAHLDFCRAS